MAERILIVEDSALVVGALRLLLEGSGFAVDAAGGVPEAVTLCRASQPDVMLLDLGLRDGSGFDVLAQLAREGPRPRVIVAVTGDDHPEVRQRCLDAGCAEVLVKPIAPLALPATLRALLAHA